MQLIHTIKKLHYCKAVHPIALLNANECCNQSTQHYIQ